MLEELEEINQLLNSGDEDFWNNQLDSVILELDVKNEKRNLAAISLLGELHAKKYIPNILNFITREDISDLVLCEAVSTLSCFRRRLSNIKF